MCALRGNRQYCRKEVLTIAIYHCSIKIISRGKGKSAVGAAAYRSGEKLTNDYDGTTHDFTRKGGVVYTEILHNLERIGDCCAHIAVFVLEHQKDTAAPKASVVQ